MSRLMHFLILWMSATLLFPSILGENVDAHAFHSEEQIARDTYARHRIISITILKLDLRKPKRSTMSIHMPHFKPLLTNFGDANEITKCYDRREWSSIPYSLLSFLAVRDSTS